MSDDFTAEVIEEMKAHDPRYRFISQMVDIEAEIRDSLVVKLMCEVAEADAVEARKALADVEPTHVAEIVRLQNIARFPAFIRDVVEAVIRRGAAARDELNEEANPAGAPDEREEEFIDGN